MKFAKVITTIFMLIALYLVVVNGDSTARIIHTISSNAVSGIKALQGR